MMEVTNTTDGLFTLTPYYDHANIVISMSVTKSNSDNVYSDGSEGMISNYDLYFLSITGNLDALIQTCFPFNIKNTDLLLTFYRLGIWTFSQ
jgi:hypothetical protein